MCQLTVIMLWSQCICNAFWWWPLFLSNAFLCQFGSFTVICSIEILISQYHVHLNLLHWCGFQNRMQEALSFEYGWLELWIIFPLYDRAMCIETIFSPFFSYFWIKQRISHTWKLMLVLLLVGNINLRKFSNPSMYVVYLYAEIKRQTLDLPCYSLHSKSGGRRDSVYHNMTLC